jgi:hypothetical protein
MIVVVRQIVLDRRANRACLRIKVEFALGGSEVFFPSTPIGEEKSLRLSQGLFARSEGDKDAYDVGSGWGYSYSVVSYGVLLVKTS